jgi:hypothetical protein
MEILREMAVKEGYVDPSFPKTLKSIESFIQTVRDKMVSSAVEKRKEESKVTPREMLKETVEKI